MSDGKYPGTIVNDCIAKDSQLDPFANGASFARSEHYHPKEEWKSATVSKPRKVESFIKSTERRLEEIKKTTTVLEETLEYLKSFTFKEGDVVISKTHGPGIVNGIGIGESMESVVSNPEMADKFYVTIATKDGFIRVPPGDIMPYTTASKVLYERG